MAKEEKNPELAKEECQNESINRSKNVYSVTANFIIYLLCIASLGATVYSNVRLRTYDERIKSLESFLFGVGGALHPSSSSSSKGDHPSAHSAFNNYDNYEDINQNVNIKWLPGGHANTEDLLHRMQHQVAGLQRLRRDAQELPLIRPQRQVHDCVCPAGEQIEYLK